VVCGTAGAVPPGPRGGLVGQERRGLLGCDHGGAALFVGGRGFFADRSSRGLSKTRGAATTDCAPGAGAGGLRRAPRLESGAGAAVAVVARRGRGIGLRAGETGP